MKKLLFALWAVALPFIALSQRSGYTYHYYAVKTHRKGDSPAMWHIAKKKGTIAIYYMETSEGSYRNTKIVIDKKTYKLQGWEDVDPIDVGSNTYSIFYSIGSIEYTFYTHEDGLEDNQVNYAPAGYHFNGETDSTGKNILVPD